MGISLSADTDKAPDTDISADNDTDNISVVHVYWWRRMARFTVGQRNTKNSDQTDADSISKEILVSWHFFKEKNSAAMSKSRF